MLEPADHAGYAQTEHEQHQKPRYALGYGAVQGLFNILLGGKSRKLCVVVAEPVVNRLYKVGGGDYAQHLVICAEDGNGILAVVLKPFYALLYLLISSYNEAQVGSKMTTNFILIKSEMSVKSPLHFRGS